MKFFFEVQVYALVLHEVQVTSQFTILSTSTYVLFHSIRIRSLSYTKIARSLEIGLNLPPAQPPIYIPFLVLMAKGLNVYSQWWVIIQILSCFACQYTTAGKDQYTLGKEGPTLPESQHQLNFSYG